MIRLRRREVPRSLSLYGKSNEVEVEGIVDDMST